MAVVKDKNTGYVYVYGCKIIDVYEDKNGYHIDFSYKKVVDEKIVRNIQTLSIIDENDKENFKEKFISFYTFHNSDFHNFSLKNESEIIKFLYIPSPYAIQEKYPYEIIYGDLICYKFDEGEMEKLVNLVQTNLCK